MSGKLARKRKLRASHRASTRKIISSVEEILEAFDEDNLLSPLNTTRLRQQKLLLEEKLDTIRNLDQEILAVVTDILMEEEICEADEFTSFTQLAVMRIDAALTVSLQTPSTKLRIAQTLPGTKLEIETHLTPSSPPGIAVTSSETHLTPSSPPGIAVTSSETHLTPSTSSGIVVTTSETHRTPLTPPGIAVTSSETHLTPSTSSGIVVTSSETHLIPSSPPGIAVTSSETHLTPSTPPGIVLSPPETHLSLSTSPGVVYAASEARVIPSTAPEISFVHSQQAHGYPPVAPGISNTYGIGTQVKLPKLDLKKFNGDISKWPSFWDAFESSVHNNTRLAAIDKFNYLNSLLMKSASEAISGLSITAANYDEAVTILKRRFGNKQLIINRHMETLLNVNSVKSGPSGNTQPLRQLYDLIESQVRSLNSLGVSSNSYRSLLSSVVMSKLPQDLRLIVSREVKDEWDLDRILEVFRSELEARERASGSNVHTTEQLSNKFPNSKGRKELPTDAALFTKESKPTCTYCRIDHASNACKTVTNVAARKDVLKRAGRCFICLRRNHISKDCTSKMKCFKCGQRHHVSICASDIGDGIRPLHGIPTVNGSPSPQGPPRESNGSTALYVNTSTPILLQTAKAVIYRPDQPTEKFLA